MKKEIINDEDIQLLTIQEACKRLHISNTSLYQQINKGAIKTVKIGKRRLISVRALREFIEANESDRAW